MHYEKFKGKADVRRVLEHSDRGQAGVSDHEHSNEKIDPERSHLNYELKDRGGLSAVEYHRKRIEQIAEETKQRTGKALRKDAVTLCSWAVTAPQDLPEDKQADFFKGVYEWFSERYGEDNIVTAAVHRDETSPHMHLQFVPIIEDKDGTRRLCAKDLETKRTLQTVHQKLEKHLTQELGCKVTLLNGATDNGNKTITELKLATLQAQVKELSDQLAELRTARSEEVFEKAGAIKAIGEKLSGGKKLTAAEVETVKNVAAVVAQMQAEYQRQTEEAEKAKSTAESLQNELQATLQQEQEKIQAEAQRFAESAVIRSQREASKVKQQASAEIDTMRQERDRAVKQQAVLQQQLRQERERTEQAIELATGYAYLVNEIGVPEYLEKTDGEYWKQLQALRQPEQKQEQEQTPKKSFGMSR